MTVVLSGIGADTTNLGALGPISADGNFEYVPIPEKTHETRESHTFGTWPLRAHAGVAADLSTRIHPRPVREPDFAVTGEAAADWPLHHDPNFAALTYGEHRTTGYVARLRALESGDIVGFYAGLRGPEGRAHRYLIGYFTVDAVVTIDPDTPRAEARRILASHPENAHAKRAVDGVPYLEDKSIVLVDGREPGGLFDRHPVRLSEYTVAPGNSRPGYSIREAVETAFDVREGGRSMAYKPAYRGEIDPEDFLELVGPPGDRSAADAALVA